MKQKSIVAIHDISCHGKCSLTVALPIISATGISTNIIPTAILSTHTGGFTDYTYVDLTDQIEPIQNHWKSIGLDVDCIFTGFLGSTEQVNLVSNFIDSFDSELVVIDPAMADFGKLYPTFDSAFPKEMAKLCQKGDIIVPNITEALFLLGKDFVEGPYDKSFIENLLIDLSKICKKIILTGTLFENNKYGIVSYDADENLFDYYFIDKIKGNYHGTGDIFASALVASLLHDFSIANASKIATDFTTMAIKKTQGNSSDYDYRSGVAFEMAIPSLLKDLNII